ncbi:hypothetical protein [Vibrio bivalvicida]|uniref:Uncharacterized protein n=1 Tax=Vibrio bivalvicida TaxID=1276888 RepID=A0ABV4MDS7_9VIBR
MKLNQFALVSVLCLATTKIVSAADTHQDLFLYSLPEPEDAGLLVAHQDTVTPLVATDLSLPVELEYDEPCDVKCGVSMTGLVLLHMIVEGKADQEYRYSLMNPNYEP